MVRGIKGSSGYLNCKSTEPDDNSDSQDSIDDRYLEITNIKHACNTNKEALKNRYYRYTPVFQPCISLNCPDIEAGDLKSIQEPQRPHKKPKSLQVLQGICESDYERSFQRKQDQFKSFQQLQKLQSQLEKKQR